jgi:hypothetical protein
MDELSITDLPLPPQEKTLRLITQTILRATDLDFTCGASGHWLSISTERLSYPGGTNRHCGADWSKHATDTDLLALDLLQWNPPDCSRERRAATLVCQVTDACEFSQKPYEIAVFAGQPEYNVA